MPLGYFYFWVLSDTLCMALMMVSVVLLIYFNDSHKKLFLVLAFLFSLSAGLTQTYGMIPFLILATLLFKDTVIFNRQPSWGLLLSVCFNLLLWFFLQKCWETVIPHIVRPTNFELLHLGIGMAAFYFNVWSFVFLPLTPVVLAMFIQISQAGLDLKGIWIKICVIVMFFMSITFFYQWSDSRFTFIYIPLIFMMLLALIQSNKKSKLSSVTLVISAVLYGITGFFVAPSSYWGPKISTLEIAPHKTWLVQAWLAVPNDRFQLAKNCNNLHSFCEQAMVSTTEPYENKILTAYKAARLLQQP